MKFTYRKINIDMQTKLNTKRLSLFFLPSSLLAKRKRFLSSSFSQSTKFPLFRGGGGFEQKERSTSCRVCLSAPVVEVDFGRARLQPERLNDRRSEGTHCAIIESSGRGRRARKVSLYIDLSVCPDRGSIHLREGW